MQNGRLIPTSPRSIEACRVLGVDPTQLQKQDEALYVSTLEQKGFPVEFATLKYQKKEERRKVLLTKCIEARKAAIEQEGNMKTETLEDVLHQMQGRVDSIITQDRSALHELEVKNKETMVMELLSVIQRKRAEKEALNIKRKEEEERKKKYKESGVVDKSDPAALADQMMQELAERGRRRKELAAKNLIRRTVAYSKVAELAAVMNKEQERAKRQEERLLAELEARKHEKAEQTSRQQALVRQKAEELQMMKDQQAADEAKEMLRREARAETKRLKLKEELERKKELERKISDAENEERKREIRDNADRAQEEKKSRFERAEEERRRRMEKKAEADEREEKKKRAELAKKKEKADAAYIYSKKLAQMKEKEIQEKLMEMETKVTTNIQVQVEHQKKKQIESVVKFQLNKERAVFVKNQHEYEAEKRKSQLDEVFHRLRFVKHEYSRLGSERSQIQKQGQDVRHFLGRMKQILSKAPFLENVAIPKSVGLADMTFDQLMEALEAAAESSGYDFDSLRERFSHPDFKETAGKWLSKSGKAATGNAASAKDGAATNRNNTGAGSAGEGGAGGAGDMSSRCRSTSPVKMHENMRLAIINKPFEWRKKDEVSGSRFASTSRGTDDAKKARNKARAAASRSEKSGGSSKGDSGERWPWMPKIPSPPEALMKKLEDLSKPRMSAEDIMWSKAASENAAIGAGANVSGSSLQTTAREHLKDVKDTKTAVSVKLDSSVSSVPSWKFKSQFMKSLVLKQEQEYQQQLALHMQTQSQTQTQHNHHLSPTSSLTAPSQKKKV